MEASEVWFEKSGSRVIRAGHEGLKARLVHLSQEWGAKLEMSTISTPAREMGSEIDMMPVAEDSGSATRAILGWLGDARGLDADMNIELLALRDATPDFIRHASSPTLSFWALDSWSRSTGKGTPLVIGSRAERPACRTCVQPYKRRAS